LKVVLRISVTVSSKFFSQKELFLPLRKDILRRICPIDLKFSGFVVLSKFGVLKRELFHPVHFVKVIH